MATTRKPSTTEPTEPTEPDVVRSPSAAAKDAVAATFQGFKRKKPKKWDLVTFEPEFIDSPITMPSLIQLPIVMQQILASGKNESFDALAKFIRTHAERGEELAYFMFEDIEASFDAADMDEFFKAWSNASGGELGKS